MYINYIVGEKESLSDIALKFNISEDSIINANKISNKRITPGMKLLIPVANSNYNYYQVKSGESLYDVSVKTNTDLNLLAEINGLLTYDYLYPGQIVMIPKKNVRFYKTKEGDTLSKIVKTNGSTVNSIILSNPNIYLVEEQLIAIKD